MESSLTLLAAPFERMTAEAAATLLDEHFGLAVSALTRLDTERDDSFRVESAEGDFVLKVAHPADDPLVINLQTAALAFAGEATPPLPLQRILPSLEGELEPSLRVDDAPRIARVLTWLPGAPVFEVRPDESQLELLGETLGRVSAALVDFRHPAAERRFAWDAAQLPLVRGLVGLFPSAEITAAFKWFDTAVAPLLQDLPRQVAYNDFHPGNVLADRDGPGFVTGVLDFGDVVHTARVVDLAVAISYLRHPCRHTDEEVDRFIAGFERHVPLTDAERAVLPALVAARFTERILINSWLARGNPDDRASAAQAAEGNRLALGAVLESR